MKTMKRSAFLTALAGLFGVARAQKIGVTQITKSPLPSQREMLPTPQWRECKVKPDELSERYDPDWGCSQGIRKALNGQCPCCGTLTSGVHGRDRSVVFISGNGMVASDPQLNRCLRCNAAFWSDAEEPKK